MDKTNAQAAASGRRRIAVVPASGRRTTAIRSTALRRAQDARRSLAPRHERFAHLKHMYD